MCECFHKFLSSGLQIKLSYLPSSFPVCSVNSGFPLCHQTLTYLPAESEGESNEPRTQSLSTALYQLLSRTCMAPIRIYSDIRSFLPILNNVIYVHCYSLRWVHSHCAQCYKDHYPHASHKFRSISSIQNDWALYIFLKQSVIVYTLPLPQSYFSILMVRNNYI